VPFTILRLHERASLVGRGGVLCELFGGQQLVGTERHGQKLLEGHDSVLAELVVHQNGSAGLFKKQSSQSEKSFLKSQDETGTPIETQRKRLSYIAELANELSAHATRASRGRDVSGDGDGAEIASFGTLLGSFVVSQCLSTDKTHTRITSLTCWVTAVAIATRSAQVPTGYAAFSTLAPVTMVPPDNSRAQPTWNFEYGPSEEENIAVSVCSP
jgi:hypothetical protein